MAFYIDDEAKENNVYAGSEEEMSDVTSHQGREVVSIPRKLLGKGSRRFVQTSSSSESDEDEDSSSSRSRFVHIGGKRKPRRYIKSHRETYLFSELKKANELMTSIAKKMRRQESRLQAIENKLDSASSSSSCNVTPKRSSVTREVPCEVRVSRIILFLLPMSL